MRIDLHMHSNASDGQYAPAELMMIAATENINTVALTDHDTVLGIREAADACRELGLRFIPGIEISSELPEMPGEDIHILGYCIDADNADLMQKCAEFEADRLNRGEKIRDFLEGKGIAVDMDEIAEIRGNGSLGRPHFAEYLMRHGIVATKREAFDRFLDTEEFNLATRRIKPTPEEAVGIIKDAGGRAVLAHPGLIHRDDEWKREFIYRMKGSGLEGMECFYGKHSPEETEFYLSIAKELGLKTGCGSDFHGEKVKPDVKIGMEMPDEFAGMCVCELV